MTSATTPLSTQREPALVGQTVVVIGGNAGIGLETARRARAEGADVILTGRNPDRLKQAALELGAPVPPMSTSVPTGLILPAALRATSSASTMCSLIAWRTWAESVSSSIGIGAVYCHLQRISMASPHATGVAALIVSSGVTSPGAVAARIQDTADPMACPADPSLYAFSRPSTTGRPRPVREGRATTPSTATARSTL